MNLFEVGRLCVKLAGRDAGKKCVVVENSGEGYVVVDGSTRRKKVNVKHLEPLSEMVELKNKASHDDVKKAFQKLGLPVWDKKSKKVAERPRKVRKVKPVKEEKKVVKKKVEVKKEVKAEVKETPKVESKEVKTEEKSEVNKE
jgi:large subunit ribosomal protein L14e